MTEKTREFLEECEKAGYKTIAVLVRDKRVPRSVSIKPGPWFGDEPAFNGTTSPIKVVCAVPERKGEHFAYPGNSWPKIWSIVKKCGLVNGMIMGGFGTGNPGGDCTSINEKLIGGLTLGCYELPEALNNN